MITRIVDADMPGLYDVELDGGARVLSDLTQGQVFAVEAKEGSTLDVHLPGTMGYAFDRLGDAGRELLDAMHRSIPGSIGRTDPELGERMQRIQDDARER
jgi:hypothetical protein